MEEVKKTFAELQQEVKENAIDGMVTSSTLLKNLASGIELRTLEINNQLCKNKNLKDEAMREDWNQIKEDAEYMMQIANELNEYVSQFSYYGWD